MPRITPLRVVLTPVFLYVFCVLLWVVLPCSPSVHSGNNSHYHQDVLRAGKRLTTVHGNDRHLYYVAEDDNVYRHFFAIDWQLTKDLDNNSLLLTVGTNTSINLTSYADATEPFVDLPVVATVRAGDTDGVMLPWFSDADASLLNWEIEGDMKILQLTVVVPEPGVVQVWPRDERLYEVPPEIPGPYDRVKVFATITGIPTTGDRTDMSTIQVDDMTWFGPSLTFPTRRWVLHALKPITLNVVAPMLENIVFPAFSLLFWLIVVIFTVISLMLEIAVVGAMIVGVCWLIAGRPPFEAFARGYWMSAWLYKKRASPKRIVYGPSGPIEEEWDPDNSDLELQLQLQGPRPLTGVVDFFRSRSPLDDLCITFESTKWLVEPMGSARPRARNRFEPSDGIADAIVEEGKFKIGY